MTRTVYHSQQLSYKYMSSFTKEAKAYILSIGIKYNCTYSIPKFIGAFAIQ